MEDAIKLRQILADVGTIDIYLAPVKKRTGWGSKRFEAALAALCNRGVVSRLTTERGKGRPKIKCTFHPEIDLIDIVTETEAPPPESEDLDLIDDEFKTTCGDCRCVFDQRVKPSAGKKIPPLFILKNISVYTGSVFSEFKAGQLVTEEAHTRQLLESPGLPVVCARPSEYAECPACGKIWKIEYKPGDEAETRRWQVRLQAEAQMRVETENAERERQLAAARQLMARRQAEQDAKRLQESQEYSRLGGVVFR